MAYAKITLIGAMDYYTGRDEDLFDFLQLPEGLEEETLIDDLVYRAGDFEMLHINPEYTRYAIGAFCSKWMPTWQRWSDVMNAEYNPLHNYDRYEESEDNRTGSGSSTGSNGYTKGNTGSQTVTDTGTSETNNTGTQTDQISANEATTSVSSEVTDSSENVNSSEANNTLGNSGSTTTNKVAAFNESSFSNKEETTVSEHNNSATSGSKSSTDDLDRKVDTTGAGNKINQETDTRTDALKEVTTDARSNQRIDALSETLTGTDNRLTAEASNNLHNAHLYGNIGVTTSQQMVEAENLLRLKWNLYDRIADMFIEEFFILIY